MKALAKWIIKYRHLCFGLAVVVCVASLFLMRYVNVNYDLSEYLSSKTETKQALNAMKGEFDEVSVLKLLAEGKSDAEVEALIERIKNEAHVILVSSQKKDGDTLITVNINQSSYAPEAEETAKNIMALAGDGYIMVGAPVSSMNLRNSIMKEMPVIMLIAVVIVFLVLTLTSRSWLEPGIFTVVVAMAILMNMGTNVIFDSISYITNAVGAILQLALAMDYSIILLNNFAAVKNTGLRGKEAMIEALSMSFAPIASSALTTIAGLFALVFMSFRIGFDIGIVLSKGIVFSMLCVFLVMPSLILALERPIEKLSHKPIRLFGDKIAKLSLKVKWVLPVLFVVLVVVSAVFSSQISYTYAGALRSDEEKLIVEKFGESTQVVLLYDSTLGYEEERALSEKLSSLDGVDTVLSWGSIELTPEIIAQAAPDLDPAYAELLPSFLPENMRYVCDLYDAASSGGNLIKDVFDKRLTASELTELSGVQDVVADMIVKSLGDSQTISLSELIEGIEANPFLTLFMTDEQKELITSLTEIYDNADAYTSRIKDALEGVRPLLVSNRYKRMLLTLDMPIENEATYALLARIKDETNSVVSDNFMAGESVINRDIATSFKLDNIIINVFTVVAIVLIIGLTFMSLSVPVLLVAIIQGAIWISMSMSAIFASPVFFISYIICVCIQMGATIDYGILVTDFYIGARKRLDRKEAAIFALNEAMPTIFTSGIILIIASFIIGTFSSIMPISSIGLLLSRGSIVSVFTVIAVLPALLVLFDKPLLKLTRRKKGRKEDGEEREESA